MISIAEVEKEDELARKDRVRAEQYVRKQALVSSFKGKMGHMRCLALLFGS